MYLPLSTSTSRVAVALNVLPKIYKTVIHCTTKRNIDWNQDSNHNNVSVMNKYYTQMHNDIVIPRVIDSSVVDDISVVVVTVDGVVLLSVVIDDEAVPVVSVGTSVVVWFT